jgi:hypothetical protein
MMWRRRSYLSANAFRISVLRFCGFIGALEATGVESCGVWIEGGGRKLSWTGRYGL